MIFEIAFGWLLVPYVVPGAKLPVDDRLGAFGLTFFLRHGLKLVIALLRAKQTSFSGLENPLPARIAKVAPLASTTSVQNIRRFYSSKVAALFKCSRMKVNHGSSQRRHRRERAGHRHQVLHQPAPAPRGREMEAVV